MDRDDISEAVHASHQATDTHDVPRLSMVRRGDLAGPPSTGEAIAFRGEKKGTDKGIEVGLSSETTRKTADFFDTYVTRLGKLVGEPAPTGSTHANLYEEVINDPSRERDKLLMKIVSESGVAEDGKTLVRKVNREKLEAFLETSEGKATAVMLMEDYNVWAELGLGIDATMRVHKSYVKVDKDTVAMGEAGALRRIGRAVTSGRLTESVASLFRTENGVVFKTDIDLLEALKNKATPIDKAYLKAIAHIDLDGLSIVQVGKDKKIERSDSAMPPVDELKKTIAGNAIARREYFMQLGVPEKDIRMPEDFILNSEKSEPIDVDYFQDILSEYRASIGAPGKSNYERVVAMARAREKVMVKYLERYLKLEESNKGNEKIESLKAKRDAMKENPQGLIAEKKQKIDEEKTKVQEKKADAEKRKRELVDPLPAKVQAVDNIEAQMMREFKLPVGENFEALVEQQLTGLKSELTTAKSNLKTERTNKAGELAGHSKDVFRRFDAHTRAIRQIADRMGAAASGEKGKAQGRPNLPATPNFDKLIEQQNTATTTRYDSLIEEYQTEIKELTEKVTALEAKFREYQTAINDRELATLTIASREPGQLQAGQDAFKKFYDPASGVTLVTEADLGTLSVDELADKLSATVTDPQERIKLAFLAKAEAKGRQEQIPDYQKEALAEVADPSTGISPDDLFRSVNELGAILRTADPDLSHEDARDKLLAARQAAGRMLQARYKARVDLEIAYYDKAVKDKDKEIEKLGDFTKQVEELDVTIEIMEGHTDVYARAYEVADSNESLQNLADDSKVGPEDITYSEAERNAGLGKGYYEWVRLLHPDYVDDPKKRNEVFEAIHRILPPDKLAELLNTHLGLGLAGTFTLDAVFKKIDPASRKLGGQEVQQAAKQIINYVRDRGLAL